MKVSENLMYCEIYESNTGHDGEHLCWECVEFWDQDADGFVGKESECGQNECCARCGSDLTIRADGSTIEIADESEAVTVRAVISEAGNGLPGHGDRVCDSV